MLLALFHPGDLSFWELMLILAVWALMLLVLVGLPLCLIAYIVYRVARYRRDMSESKSSEPIS